MKFYDYTIIGGEVFSRQENDTGQFDPDALAMCGELFQLHGTDFRADIPKCEEELFLMFSVDNEPNKGTEMGDDAAILSLFQYDADAWKHEGFHKPLTVSLLLTGRQGTDHRREFRYFNFLLSQTYSAYGLEPSLDYTHIPERPLLMTLIPWWVVDLVKEGSDLIALCGDFEQCMAAAWFERVQAQGQGGDGARS